MDETEKFLFDLEGYLVIENVLGVAELAALNELVDTQLKEGWDNDPHNDFTKCSTWGPASTALIDHPRILPYLVELIGPTVRIDHDYAIIMDRGEERGGLHGGPSNGGTHYYTYHDGVMRNGLTVVTYFLSDAGAGDGGFGCVPGSHKSNFRDLLPSAVRCFGEPAHYVRQPPAKAGDALIFTEALMHGTMPWRASHQRRTLLYKYSPGHCTWMRAPYDLSDFGELSQRQKRVMAPASSESHLPVLE